MYEGEFRLNNFDGKGKYTYINGNVYEGDFKDDCFHGKGTFYYSDGKRFSDMWG